MKLILLCALAIFIAVISANDFGQNEEHVEVSQNFNKVGYFATGLTYGHIHATVKFNLLKKAVKDVLRVLQQRRAISTSVVERNLIDILQPQVQIAEEALDDLQVCSLEKTTNETNDKFFWV